MLATAGPLPTGPDWTYEVKWDGFRAIYSDGSYQGRSGRRLDGPLLPVDDVVLDGELVAFNAEGRPSFAAMQQRGAVAYVAFDLLAEAGVPLLDLPLEQRRQRLEVLPVTVSPWFSDGAATVAAAREMDLEGVVAKRRRSRYLPGIRTADWINFKFVSTGDFVVGGWRPGARRLGALLVGTPVGTGLRYRGRVGGGISRQTEELLLTVFGDLDRADSPFDGPLAEPATILREVRWVEPVLVVEVRYGEITADGRLRFPVLLRLRPDKSPEDCASEAGGQASGASQLATP